jgi:muramoyltetrapeptide carboxypeptidase LdcA involved in peptidoglycan recycling
MLYPKFLAKDSIIGVTAPSDGNKKETDFIRLDNAKKQFLSKGYSVIETEHVRFSEKGRSADGKTRAAELMELIDDNNVDWIIAAKGGDYLMEMLSCLDFNRIKEHPTWFQGFSDNTGITFTVTTNYDIATLYGCNFNDFGMEEWHKCLEDNLSILEGKKVKQTSFDFYEDGFYDRVTGIENYRLDKQIIWRNYNTNGGVTVSGRLIGGCLDVLLNLAGTRFDKTAEFIQKYKDDGILWYLESFALNSDALTRGLWQLKEAGWFQYVKGFLFGRPAFFTPAYDIPYEEAVLSILGELNVPIILEADIGHKPPQMTLMNGAIAVVHSQNGKGSISFEMV